MEKQTAKKSTPKLETMKFDAPKTMTRSRSRVMPTEEQIRARAFEIYQRRKGGPGDPVADWTQAERELRREFGC
jgi:hypothetical protein